MKRLITPVALVVVLAAAAAIPASGAVGSPPANDHFASAEEIEGQFARFEGHNVEATVEAGEPAHAGGLGAHSVWYTWTAPQDGTTHIGIDPDWADVGPLLAVYTGDSVDDLTEIARGRMRIAYGDKNAYYWRADVYFAAVAGTRYRIAVDSPQGWSDHFSGSLSSYPTPEHDAFADARVIQSLEGEATISTRGASLEPGEPTVHGRFGTGSAWFEWTAPATRYVRFKLAPYIAVQTGRAYVAVYTGTAVDALTLVAEPRVIWLADVEVGTSFRAEAGATYMIAVADGFPGSLHVGLRWYPGTIQIGTARGEVLRGSPGRDVIDARRGNDIVYGFSANDKLIGGLGGDRLYGGPGNDWLKSRDFRRGNDTIYGGTGRDTGRADPGDLIRGVP